MAIRDCHGGHDEVLLVMRACMPCVCVV
jgi:hypothetical protein